MAFSFSTMPSVSISRSKFDRVSGHKLSFNLGEIVPLYVDEVLPGDTRKIDVSTLIRMSTPIAPIMDDIEMDLMAFMVPNRLTFAQWREVMGENTTGAGAAAAVTIPKVTVTNGAVTVGTIGDHMGLPNVSASYDVSVLPLRGYKLIYNRWFRNQNVTAPVTVDISSSTTYDDYNVACYTAAKKPDYFTRALPYAQKGNPVTIPLGTSAPVRTSSVEHVYGSMLGNPLKFRNSDGTASGSDLNLVMQSISTGEYNARTGQAAGTLGSKFVEPTNLIADLSLATAATINTLRIAFQTQKLLEKDALYGTRYWEILYAHFGVQSPDATLQDPEYLGGQKFMINVDQVLQTTGYDDSSSSELGQPGANSVTGWKGSLFTKSFVEHGFLFILGVARQKHRTYGQGLNRMFSRFGRYDFYWPVFANLGAQEVKNQEIFAGTAGNFGYQEAWAEYRYKPNLVSGILNPARANSLDYWTLAEAFASCPTLGDTFIKEDRANLSRALVTGASGPDFIADVYFKDVAVRPMPTYSIPGLIDHH